MIKRNTNCDKQCEKNKENETEKCCYLVRNKCILKKEDN